jgi:transcriptional regulator with XRE-family HTH domain
VPNPRLSLVDRERRRLHLKIGEELRQGRLNAGLTQATVATALGCSTATVSRVEAARTGQLSIDRVLRHAAMVGLVVRVGLYPVGHAVRDARQLRLEQRYRSEISSQWGWRSEVGLPIPGDLRAVDAVLTGSAIRIAHEFISSLGDVQAQLRAALLKQRDGGFERLIIVIAGTHANRRALALARDAIGAYFPVSPRIALSALREFRDPGGNAIVLL